MFNVEKVVEIIKDMSKITGKTYEDVWKYYTHDFIKENVNWEDVKKVLDNKGEIK